MACLFPLFYFSAFWAAHCPSWSIKPLAFSVLSFWRGERKSCPEAPLLCAFHGPSLGEASVHLYLILSIAGMKAGFAPLHFCGRQEEGLSPCYGAGRSVLP